MTIQILPGFDRPHQVRELFTEYTQFLIEGDSGFREYLIIQNYDEELLHLEQKYGPPRGRLYLVFCDQQLAGCVALHPLNDACCEIKRLYVRPAFRRMHIGSALVDRLIAEARSIGYQYILLDTFPFLQTAIRMYRKRGFYEIPKYNNSPMESTIYMKLDL